MFIPGLLAPRGAAPEPDAPGLARLFRFGDARKESTAPYTDALFRLFGFADADGDHPVAAVTRLIDADADADADAASWIRADPVHLRPGRSGVILSDHATFELDQREAALLADELREPFTRRRMKLETHAAVRWYVKLPAPPRLRTTPVHEVAGHDVRLGACAGANRLSWEQLSNEIQMCLHQSPVNAARERRGEPSINGLWLWGCGALPAPPPPIWSRVFGDALTLRGLAALCGVHRQLLPATLDDLVANSRRRDKILLVESAGLRHQQYHDPAGWHTFIDRLESAWFAKAETLFRLGELRELQLLTEGLRLEIKKTSFIKRWRRARPFTAYCRVP